MNLYETGTEADFRLTVMLVTVIVSPLELETQESITSYMWSKNQHCA